MTWPDRLGGIIAVHWPGVRYHRAVRLRVCQPTRPQEEIARAGDEPAT